MGVKIVEIIRDSNIVRCTVENAIFNITIFQSNINLLIDLKHITCTINPDLP